MWLTVLVLALVATVDPIRVGVSVALSSRPRASRALLAFWLGGVAISIVLAAGVLFGLRDVALTTMHRVQLAAATPTAGHLQIGMGVFALLIAGTAIGFPPSGPSRTGLPDGHSTHRSSAATLSTWSARAQNALQARPIGVAFALGVGMLVDFRFLAALTAILASGAAIGAQVCAAGVYTLVALTFVELPLVSQLAAPAQTDRVMAAVNRWAKARRKQVFAFVLGLLGVFLLTRGFGHA
ncbi:GAP family protein [Mycobacterium sp. ML4]